MYRSFLIATRLNESWEGSQKDPSDESVLISNSQQQTGISSYLTTTANKRSKTNARNTIHSIAVAQ